MCWAGAALVIVTTLIGSGFTLSVSVVALAAWALVPFVVLWVLPRWWSNPWAHAGGAIAVFLGEVYIRTQVFLFPGGSTAALALLFSPLYLTGLALPVGLGVGWTVGQAWHRSRTVGRSVVVMVGVACVLVGAIAVFRPGVLPYRLGKMVSTRERIGPPRVVVGEAFIRKTRLSSRPAWHQVGEFDAVPAQEIASINTHGAILFDPVTGAEKHTIAFSGDAGRKWNWFSRLVRDGSELVIVQTGGGYSDVEVLDLEGRTRWRFRPDDTLPPIALLPRDLDGDGRLEFYAASKDSVYRLDASGKVVWAHTVKGLVNALDAGTGGNGQPPIVVAVDAVGRAWTWDAGGRAVHEFALPGSDYRYKLVDWPHARSLVGGSRAIRALDFAGRVVFEHGLGDFRYADAVAVRLDPAGPSYLAVLAAAPRDIGFWRLLVFSAAGDVVYDEVLARGGATVMAARDASSGDQASTGRQALLLSDGNGLIAYQRDGGR